MLQGWKCPVCGGGVSPLVERCPCVPAATITWPVLVPTTIPVVPTVTPWIPPTYYLSDGT